MARAWGKLGMEGQGSSYRLAGIRNGRAWFVHWLNSLVRLLYLRDLIVVALVKSA